MTPTPDWTIAELRPPTSATSRRMTPSTRLSRERRWSRRSKLRGGRSLSIRIQGPNIGSSRRIALSMTPRLLVLPGSGPLRSCTNGLIKRSRSRRSAAPMPDPLSTIFISSSPIGSDARESAGVSIISILGGIQMDPLWRTALWQQFGATIDMLENALLACPSTHWHGRLWSDQKDHPQPSESAAFWYITYHTLFWLDLYLTGSREGFA